MNDKQLEALVNHVALEAGAGLGLGTLYGDMALAVAKEVRERCAKLCEQVADDGDAWRPLDGTRGVALRAAAARIRGA